MMDDGRITDDDDDTGNYIYRFFLTLENILMNRKVIVLLTPLILSSTSSVTAFGIGSIGRISIGSVGTALQMSTRKAGVSSPDEIKAFVQAAGSNLLVVDVRNPDTEKEPGDQKSFVVAALPSTDFRPQARSLIYDRESKSMPLPDVSKDNPIITHCGGGGRGQCAKEFLEAKGFTNVINGGGPKETDCWDEFGGL